MRASHLILAVALSTASLTSVHAQTYRWVDENGVVNFSQELPAPDSGIQELSVVEGTATLSSFEQRALELINEERRALAQQRAGAASEAGAQPITQSPISGAIPPSPSSGPAAMRARATAARDPCLLSPDPRCFEKNARNYDPYHGYTPAHAAVTTTIVGAPGAPTGATVTGSTGGQVAGAASVPVRLPPGPELANTASR